MDYLRGLKENVILGRLIPAGTGMPLYRNIQIEEGQYPEITASAYGADAEFDDEYSRMAAHVEELQGLSEIDGEGL